MESILPPPQWPTAFSNFVTWCLMWDPKNRPTSSQALKHEYFADAVDPLRPKSSTARLLGRKQSDKSFRSPSREHGDAPTLSSKSSWFRRSLIGRAESPAPTVEAEPAAARPAIVAHHTVPEVPTKAKAGTSKRATWTNGAPMPILPSIRPVSPLSNAVTAQGTSTTLAPHGEAAHASNADASKASKKIGRQLSVNSHGNHYADVHRLEAERALNGLSNTGSAASAKESFFSHLRKRARRFSGRNQANVATDDVEANAGCMPWSNRSSVALDSGLGAEAVKPNADLSDLDKALQNVKYALDASGLGNVPVQVASPADSLAKRQSLPHGAIRSTTESPTSTIAAPTPISSRTRRGLQITSHPMHRYETPEEEDELLDEVLHTATKAATRLAQSHYLSQAGHDGSQTLPSPYPTPSPSAKCGGEYFSCHAVTPLRTENASSSRQWPTPPYEQDEWAKSTAATLAGGGSIRR